MNWLEFYKEQYYKEIERKDKLNEKSNKNNAFNNICINRYISNV